MHLHCSGSGSDDSDGGGGSDGSDGGGCDGSISISIIFYTVH